MSRSDGPKPHEIPLAVVVIVAGVVLAGVTAWTKFGDEAKKDRLRAEGVPMVASVVDGRSKNGRYDDTKLVYKVDEVVHEQWIGGRASGTGMLIWYDPARPDEFVAESGYTDDSLSTFNTWAGMPWGVAIAAIGTAWLRHLRKGQAVPPRVRRRRGRTRR